MRRITRICLLVAGLTCLTDCRAKEAALPSMIDAPSAAVLAQDGALLIDTRPRAEYDHGHIRHAVFADWPKLVEIGQLADPGKKVRALSALLASWGVEHGMTIITYSEPLNGWGEDAYLVWLLRESGFSRAAFVNGGFSALRGYLRVITAQPAVRPSQLRLSRYPEGLSKEDLRDGLKQLQALDVRERREYDGATPYGEKRGGHIPGAKHLWYKDLLDQRGYVLGKEALLARLRAAGVVPGQPVVPYCTAGVRSAWVTLVLKQAGLEATNYHGSMTEWAEQSATHYPLER